MVSYKAPSEFEQEHYYDGLKFSPRLVARTSTDVWDPATRKLLLNTARGHRALNLWNDPGMVLVKKIQLELCERGVSFTSIGLWRIGYSHDFAPSRRAPPVVLITVHRGSTSWKEGLEAALGCKAVLEQYGVADVHCEVREPLQES